MMTGGGTLAGDVDPIEWIQRPEGSSSRAIFQAPGPDFPESGITVTSGPRQDRSGFAHGAVLFREMNAIIGRY